MNNFESVGVGFGGDLGCTDLERLASLAEKLRFHSLWVQEGDDRSSVLLAAAALNATKKIAVGTAITSPFRRHPHTLAVETATLNEASNSRFILGIGSAERLMHSFRISGKPIEGMRDALAILRGMFESDNFTYDGKAFSLNIPQARLKFSSPIYMGAIGPKMLDLVGELADGLLLTRRGTFSPLYTRYAIARVVEKARQIGRDTAKINFLGFFETSISEDGEEARQFAKKILATYTIPRTPSSVLKLAGIRSNDVETVKTNYAKGDIDTAIEHVTDDLVDKFALAGTPAQCLERLQEYRETGLKCPVLYIHGPNLEVAAELAATKIVPKLIQE